MSRNKVRKSEIAGLRKQLDDAVKKEHSFRQSEIELELGELLRDDKPEEAAEFYESALDSAKKANHMENVVLAYRNLGELHIDSAETEEEYKQAFHYLESQLKSAEELKDVNLIQLALHSLAHGYCSEASNFENENINLTKALIYGRKCLDVLNRNEDVINSDKNATSSGERADRRRAGIESVLAEILIRFGATKEATKYINLAEQYALKRCETMEHILLFQFHMVKVELLHGIRKLDFICKMRAWAAKHKITENRKVLERLYQIQSFACSSENKDICADAVEYFLRAENDGDPDEKEIVGPVLKFFVNYFGHPSRLKAALTNKEKSCIFEEIADQAVDAGFTELGMKFYSEMLKFAELDGDKERIYLACSSLSETARDMHDYKCAIEYQERCVRLVHKLYPDDEYKKFYDECDLFFSKVRLGYNCVTDKEEQFREFVKLIGTCDTNRKKSIVLEEFILFLAFYNDQTALKRWIEELIKSDALIETEPQPNVAVAKERSPLRASERHELRDFVETVKYKKEMRDVSWRNKNGENRLHLAAKIDNIKEITSLIQYGHDVNAVDNAGWTPLMEAVNYGHLDNVRLLCQKGANVNASSSAGLIDSDGNVGPSRVTPLMDACENGNTGIARLLLRFNANVDLLNEHGDTAMDLLRKYMDRRKRDMPEKDKEDCQKVLDLMEKKAVKRPVRRIVDSDEEEDNPAKKFCDNEYRFNLDA